MLENPKINIKHKLSALWTSILFLYIYADYFELYVPGKVKNLFNTFEGFNSPTSLLVASVVIAIPIIMIVLCLFLEAKINRLLNIIVGVLFTLLVMIAGSEAFTEWHAFYVLYSLLEAILTIGIIWIAWKWPKVLN
jgi:hypothetical protein